MLSFSNLRPLLSFRSSCCSKLIIAVSAMSQSGVLPPAMVASQSGSPVPARSCPRLDPITFVLALGHFSVLLVSHTLCRLDVSLFFTRVSRPGSLPSVPGIVSLAPPPLMKGCVCSGCLSPLFRHTRSKPPSSPRSHTQLKLLLFVIGMAQSDLLSLLSALDSVSAGALSFAQSSARLDIMPPALDGSCPKLLLASHLLAQSGPLPLPLCLPRSKNLLSVVDVCSFGFLSLLRYLA